MNTDHWLCWHSIPLTATVKAFSLHSHHLPYQVWHPPSSLIKLYLHIWPPALTFTWAQQSLEAPPLKIFVLFSIPPQYRPYWFCQLLAQYSQLVPVWLTNWAISFLLPAKLQWLPPHSQALLLLVTKAWEVWKKLPGAHVPHSLCCGMLGIPEFISLWICRFVQVTCLLSQ